MGLFDGLQRLKDTFIDAQPTDEIREKIVEDLKKNKRISGKGLILSVLEKCKDDKIFTFGNVGLKDEQSFRSIHNITMDEIIILRIDEGPMLLGAKKTVMILTDQFLYFRNTSGTGSNKISLSQISKYILLITRKPQQAQMENQDGLITLFQKNALASMISGTGMLEAFEKIIIIIQENLYSNNISAQEDRKALFKWLSEKYGENFFLHGIDQHTELLLASMKKELDFHEGCTLLLLKGYLYTNRNVQFYGELRMFFIDMDGYIGDTFVEKLLQLMSQYIKELSDIRIVVPNEYLGDIHLDKLETEKGNDIFFTDFDAKCRDEIVAKMKIISFYKAIRAFPYIDLTIIKTVMGNYGVPDSEETGLIRFILGLRNRGMREVFSVIKDGKEISPNWVGWVDGYGLTPLHYALILKNYQAVDFFLSNWDGLSGFLNSQKIANTYYSYDVLALILGDARSWDSIALFSEKLEPMRKSKEEAEARLQSLSNELARLNAIAYKEQQMIRSVSNPEDRQMMLEKYGEHMEQLQESMDSKQQEIVQYEEELQDIEDKIDILKQSVYNDGLNVANNLQNDQTPLAIMIRQLYLHHEKIEQSLFEENLDKFYIYNLISETSQFLFIHSDIMKEQEWMDAGTNEKILREKHKKTYGNNWFSPEAYINLDVLKEEYRILSKKYHPDNNLLNFPIRKLPKNSEFITFSGP